MHTVSASGKVIANDIRPLLDLALKIFGNREYFGPEKARALYKKGKLLERMAHEDNDSKKYLKWALDLYRKLKKENSDPPKEINELTDAEFDRLIVFWSK